jgi:DNA-binding transcriptional ArsR family regulator
MSPALLHSLNHPVRRQILRLLSKRDVEESPTKMARLIAGGLSRLSFHARTLSEQKVIRRVKTRQVRGSTESFYTSNVSENELVARILRSTEEDDGFLRMGTRA